MRFARLALSFTYVCETPLAQLVSLHREYLRRLVAGSRERIPYPASSRTHHRRLSIPTTAGVLRCVAQAVTEVAFTRGRILTMEERHTAAELFFDTLHHYHVETIVLSMSAMHWHLIARFVPVGVDPYEHLKHIGIKLTHPSRDIPPPGGGGRSVSVNAYPLPRVGRNTRRTHKKERRGVSTSASSSQSGASCTTGQFTMW